MNGENHSLVKIGLCTIYTAVFTFLLCGAFYFALYSTCNTSKGLQYIYSPTILHDSVQASQMNFKPLVSQPLSFFHYELFSRSLMCLPAELIRSANNPPYKWSICEAAILPKMFCRRKHSEKSRNGNLAPLFSKARTVCSHWIRTTIGKLDFFFTQCAFSRLFKELILLIQSPIVGKSDYHVFRPMNHSLSVSTPPIAPIHQSIFSLPLSNATCPHQSLSHIADEIFSTAKEIACSSISVPRPLWSTSSAINDSSKDTVEKSFKSTITESKHSTLMSDEQESSTVWEMDSFVYKSKAKTAGLGFQVNAMFGNLIQASKCYYWQLYNGPFLVKTVFICQYSSEKIQLHYTNAETSCRTFLCPSYHFPVFIRPRWLVKKRKRVEDSKGKRRRLVISISSLLSLAFAVFIRFNFKKNFACLIESQLKGLKSAIEKAYYPLQLLLFSVGNWKKQQNAKSKVFSLATLKQTEMKKLHSSSSCISHMSSRDFEGLCLKCLHQNAMSDQLVRKNLNKTWCNSVFVSNRNWSGMNETSLSIEFSQPLIEFLAFHRRTLFNCLKLFGLVVNVNQLYRIFQMQEFTNENQKNIGSTFNLPTLQPVKGINYQSMYLRLLHGNPVYNESNFVRTIYEKGFLDLTFTRPLSRLINKTSIDTFEYFVKPSNYDAEDAD